MSLQHRQSALDMGESFPERTEDLVLDDVALAMFCRRGKRRVRDIQAACNVLLRLDRVRSLLRVTGTAENIDLVRKQLATLSGPRRAVPAAVWAELMRTRRKIGTEDALIEVMQERCGCRIHIERSRHEVRIFGDDGGVQKADEILKELATQCTQECVPINENAQLSGASLESLANHCGVSLRIEQCRIVVFGRKTVLANAVKELRSYIADPVGHPMASVQAPEEEDDLHSNSNPQAADDVTEDEQEYHGANGGACSGCGSNHTCPTCGSARFCSHCGTMLWQVVSIPPAGGGHMGSMAAAAGGPDEAAAAAWGPNFCFVPASPQGAATTGLGPGTAPMATTHMVPVCMVPAAAQGSSSASVGGGAMMQACMVPTTMVPPMAFYSMPPASGTYSTKQEPSLEPYFAHDSPGIGG